MMRDQARDGCIRSGRPPQPLHGVWRADSGSGSIRQEAFENRTLVQMVSRCAYRTACVSSSGKTMLQTLNLNTTGRQFLVSLISDADGMAVPLLKAVESTGVVFAPVPEGVSQARVLAFSEGGLLARKEAMTWLSTHILGLPPGKVVLEDTWATPSDLPQHSPPGVERFVLRERVYFALRSKEATPSGLAALYDQAISFVVSAIYLQGDLHEVQDSSEAYSPENVRRAGGEIYADIYDKEGVIVWSRHGLPET
jgi:hypothetical protein